MTLNLSSVWSQNNSLHSSMGLTHILPDCGQPNCNFDGLCTLFCTSVRYGCWNMPNILVWWINLFQGTTWDFSLLFVACYFASFFLWSVSLNRSLFPVQDRCQSGTWKTEHFAGMAYVVLTRKVQLTVWLVKLEIGNAWSQPSWWS